MKLFNFWQGAKSTQKRDPVLRPLRACVCGHRGVVPAGLIWWQVACGKCGTLYQIEGVIDPIAERVYE